MNTQHNDFIGNNTRQTWVLVSGASGGLGKAFAVECASRGWNLFLTDLHPAPLERLAASLEQVHGVRVRQTACDLSDAAARAELFNHLRTQGLRFAMLVNVAGLDYEGAFCERSRAEIRTILRLNIEGTVEMMHGMLEFRDPLSTFRILNVASLAAFYPMPVKATYAASKRFLLDFSIALREEMRGLGVTVTALCPAGMPTTPENIAAIEAQGFLGQITTVDTGTAAAQALDAALRGQAVIIPGALNQLVHILGSLIPPAWIAALVAARWKAAWEKRPSLSSRPAV